MKATAGCTASKRYLRAPCEMPRARKGIVLQWHAALIRALVDEQPPNHTRILAVAGALLSHANPTAPSAGPVSGGSQPRPASSTDGYTKP